MFVKLEKIDIYYETYGKGTPIILIHGHGESTYIWRKVVDSLAKKLTVYAIDLKGFGNSEKPINDNYTIIEMSKLVIDFMNQLEIEKAIIACHSFAGKIGVSLTINHPKRILGLVLLGCAIGKFKIWKSFKIIQNKKIGKVIIKNFNQKIVKATLERLHDKTYKITNEDIKQFLKINENEGAINAFQSYFIDFMKEDNYINLLDKINVPTLIIWGKNDDFISVEHGKLINEKIMNSKLEVLEDCGHCISEDQPKIVSQLILDYF